jgi:hypothetical protein
MAVENKLLTVLSETEQYALYGLPDFNDAQMLRPYFITMISKKKFRIVVGRCSCGYSCELWDVVD